MSKTKQQPVILIQGPDYSAEERVAQQLQGMKITPGSTLTVTGFDESYAAIINFFGTNTKYNFWKLGDTKEALTKESINNFLHTVAQSIDCESIGPIIIASLHGKAAVDATHPHVIALSTSETKCIYTGSLFKWINDHFPSKPVELILSSCQAGAATKCVHLLPPGSKLYTFQNDGSDISCGMLTDGFRYMESHPVDQFSPSILFESSILYSPFSWKLQSPSVVTSAAATHTQKFETSSEICATPHSIPIDIIKEIYKHFELLGYKSTINELLDSNASEGLVLVNMAHAAKTMLDYIEFITTPVTDATNAKFQELDSIMKNYSRLDAAMYSILSGDNKVTTYKYPPCDPSFWHPYSEIYNLSPVLSEIKAILFHLYASTKPSVKLYQADLSPLFDEINHLATSPGAQQYAETLKSIIHDHTGMEIPPVGEAAPSEPLQSC